MRRLYIHHPDCIDDPYEIRSLGDLERAITLEAENVLSGLPQPERTDERQEQIEREAMAALEDTGSYRDSVNVRWSLRTIN